MWICRFAAGEPGGWGRHYHASAPDRVGVAGREHRHHRRPALGGHAVEGRVDPRRPPARRREPRRRRPALPLRLARAVPARLVRPGRAAGHPAGTRAAVVARGDGRRGARVGRHRHRALRAVRAGCERRARACRCPSTTAPPRWPAASSTDRKGRRRSSSGPIAPATSASTLRRAFVTETGLTFSEWRTRARLDAALPLLAARVSVGQVACQVGYASRSGFVDAFRRQFGHPPATYRSGVPAATAGADHDRRATEVER